LDEAPLDRKVTESGFEDDGGLSWVGRATTAQMKAPSADIDELARCRERGRIRGSLRPAGTRDHHANNDHSKSENCASHQGDIPVSISCCGPTASVLLRQIIQNRALDVSASERLRAFHTFDVCCNAR
jgi:hypothetical protein